MKKIVNTVCVIAGFLTLSLGILGVILPILPTTPFFLLTAVLFARGSERFHGWFMKSNLYKKYINQAFRKKEMSGRSKAKMMLVLCAIFTVGLVAAPVWYAKAIVILIAAGHLYYFVFKVRTIKGERGEA